MSTQLIFSNANTPVIHHIQHISRRKRQNPPHQFESLCKKHHRQKIKIHLIDDSIHQGVATLIVGKAGKGCKALMLMKSDIEMIIAQPEPYWPETAGLNPFIKTIDHL